jgi:transglutaminase superfamily protein
LIAGAFQLSLLRLILAAAGAAGDSTSYPSLAFFPDPGNGPEAVLLDGPVKGLTRVVFRPERTRGFPEELRPLREFPAPAPALVGLAVSRDCLWAACAGPSRIYRMDRASGSVLESFPAPGPRPGALHWDGAELWHADRSGKVFALSPGGSVRATLAVGFEPAALVRDGDRLLVSDPAASRLHVLDAASGAEVSTEPAPEKGLAGLARDGAGLWCASGNEVIRFDRRRGLPVCGFGVAPPHPAACALAGLAGDSGELWYADGAAGMIRAIREPRHGEFVASAGRQRRELFTITYQNRSAKAWERLEILQHVPFLEMPGHRYLTLAIDPPPRALYRDDLGNVSALLDLGRVEPGRSAVARIEVGLWTADRRQVVDPARFPEADDAPERRAYLADFCPIAGGDDPMVREFLLRAVGDEKNPYWKVRKAHDALCQAVAYQEAGTESVSEVLKGGHGVCRNYSAAMQAFGRLLGVPVLNSWAPRHETCFWMLPGIAPALMEVTADAADRGPASPWARCRWLLGTHRDEITTGVRGRAMHSRLQIDGREFVYGWHYWRPVGLDGLTHDGGWKVLEGRPRIVRRF